ncbi:MAG: glycosyltransferase [Bacteroidales bacterium]|nr:glycosyltransferase [Bacteroidales bacterium]
MQWLLLLILMPYLTIMLKLFSGLKKIRNFTPGKTPDIFVSVVVACRNEAGRLPGLLSDIAAQTYNCDNYELIIADDNSTDKTVRVASEYEGIRNLKVVRSNGIGKKHALKTAIEASRGELIITTDADCRAGEGWISSIASYFEAKKPHMIIGPVMPECPGGIIGNFSELEFLSLQAVTAAAAAIGYPVMCNGANLAFTKDVFLRHYPDIHFNLNTGDDVFLLHSLKADRGSRIEWLESPEAAVKTILPGNLIPFLVQRARWLSKAGHYRDRHTIIMAVVTFAAALLLTGLFISGMVKISLLPVFLAALVMKSVPDYLLLSYTAHRYGNKKIMKWFLPSTIIYPFFVLSVILFLPAGKGRR